MNCTYPLVIIVANHERRSCATIPEALSSGIARGFVENPGRIVRIGGMAFGQLYSNIVFFSSLPFAAANDRAQAQFDSLVASLIFVVATFSLLVFFASRGSQGAVKSKGVLVASAIVAAVGAVSSMPGVGDVIPTVVSGACVGIGSSVLLVSWLDVFSRGSVSGALTEVGAAFALSFALSLVLSLFGERILVLTMIACPVVSCAALLSLNRFSLQAASGKAERASTVQGRRLEMRNLICVLFFGFAVGVMRNYSASHTFGLDSTVIDAILSFSGLAICVVVVVLFRLANVSAARFLYRTSFVCILMSCVLMAAGRENIVWSVSIAFIAMQCFSCCLIARAIFASWALGGSAFRKSFATFGMLYAGEFLGVSSALVLVPITSVMQVCVVLAGALLVSYVFFFTEADFLLISKKAEPVRPQGDVASRSSDLVVSETASTGAPAVRAEASLDELCDAISAEFGLTPRESEILPSVARGRTLARIQQELFISTSTVNTHIRHIYAKCGVASRQELLDFVDDRRREREEQLVA